MFIVSEAPGTQFCALAASMPAYGGLAHGARGRPEESRALVRQIGRRSPPATRRRLFASRRQAKPAGVSKDLELAAADVAQERDPGLLRE